MILELSDVAIRYITGDFKEIGLKGFVIRKLKHSHTVKEFWVVDGVNFSIRYGSMLGIIGANGAGKSTLLKTISGIMEPTQGRVRCEGTIVALLELANGFDGDLTVRENAYLHGTVLDYTRKFMDETYRDILAFPELEEYEDRPLRQLSSGMKSRLTLSIAPMMKPDIPILDGMLSVEDGVFRKKSETKMRGIIDGGTTTILVSHSLQQVQELCNKVLWLHKGEQIAFGEAAPIYDRYQSFLDGNLKL